MSPRALVTGGAGFLGSHLCERLLQEGWEVECLDNLVTGTERNIAELNRKPGFSFRRTDISRDRQLDRIMVEADVIFHLACPASPVQYSRLPLETLEVSSAGTWRMLDVAERSGAAFVFTSTSEVYGDPEVHPQPEHYWGNVDPIGPRSMYDEGKRFGEALCTWYSKVRGTDVRIARIFNTYGPRMDLNDGRIVPTFVRQALAGESLSVHGTGTQTRSLCYVSDMVEGLFRLATTEPGEVNQGPINLGNPAELSVRQIAMAILTAAGSASPMANVDRPVGDPSRRQPDIRRANRILGWDPVIDLEDGLRKTVEWARSLQRR